jgi:hypothetical protein
VLGWLAEASQDAPAAGAVQHARDPMCCGLLQAFRSLRLQQPYVESMRQLAALGGDSGGTSAGEVLVCHNATRSPAWQSAQRLGATVDNAACCSLYPLLLQPSWEACSAPTGARPASQQPW